MGDAKVYLNMIVKNESKIIERLLRSVVDFIDGYCICDTGSTDNTIGIIQTYFNSVGINGYIVHKPFVDFGTNRTFALKECERLCPQCTHILLLDADMTLVSTITPQVFKSMLKGDVYYMFQGNEHILYKNARIVRTGIDASYWGVTHEFVKIDKQTEHITLSKDMIHIHDIGDGGSKDSKYARDIQLLLTGLEELPLNDRYLFYLGNSYRDNGQFELSIETHKKRIEIGGWCEEIWNCYNSIGRCYRLLGDMERAVFYWLGAYEIQPLRIENLYELVLYYRTNCKYKTAYQFYAIAKNIADTHTERDFLFAEMDIYTWKLDYEFTIIGFYYNPLSLPMRLICHKLFEHKFEDDGYLLNMYQNYKFYAQKLSSISFSKHNSLINALTCKFTETNFASSTPSFCFCDGGETLVHITRFVNYRIGDDGQYINDKHIITHNILSAITYNKKTGWTRITEKLLAYDTRYDGLYKGVEDMRLICFGDSHIFYSGNRGLGDIMGKIVVEYGKLDLNNACVESSNILSKENGLSTEKNWTLFKGINNIIKTVYSWSPLLVGDIIEDEFVATASDSTVPYFFKHLRGSTNGQSVNGETWFLCHLVSHEEKRHYYHIFVVIDTATGRLRRYSQMFTFEGASTEYALGLALMPDFCSPVPTFLVGYSVMDRETKHMTVTVEDVMRNFF